MINALLQNIALRLTLHVLMTKFDKSEKSDILVLAVSEWRSKKGNTQGNLKMKYIWSMEQRRKHQGRNTEETKAKNINPKKQNVPTL
jgi:hypothetical protein